MAAGGKRFLVTYFSQSGSTKKVAEAIFGALPGPKELRPLDQDENVRGYALVFVGFPLWDMAPAPAAAEFLRRKCGETRVALFYTQGNAPDFWQDKEVEGRIRAVCEGPIADRFACQGEVSDAVIEMMESDSTMTAFVEQARRTKGLPDDDALERAREFARRLASEF